jgi:hypothetical protein
LTRAIKTKTLTTFFVMLMGVAMILPSNLAIASSEGGSADGGSEDQDQGEQDQGEQETSEEPSIDEPTEPEVPIEEPIDPCVEDPNACTPEPDPCIEDPNAVGCESTEPVDPCLTNPSDPECQDPCVLNPDLPECAPPVPCPDGGDPLPDGSCPPVSCPDGGDPLPDGSCPLVPCPVGKPGCPPPPPCDPTKQQCPPIKCGKGTTLENGVCIRIKGNGGGSSSSSSSSSSSASATANVIGAEVSSCRLDGNAHGIQQKFDIAKYRACGLYPNGQIAYTDGYVLGCTQVGNTQQLCQAFVVLNTQPTQTATQPQTQSNT